MLFLTIFIWGCKEDFTVLGRTVTEAQYLASAICPGAQSSHSMNINDVLRNNAAKSHLLNLTPPFCINSISVWLKLKAVKNNK